MTLLHGTSSYVWCSILFFWGSLCRRYCGVRYSGYCWCWVYSSTLVCGVLNTACVGSMSSTSTEGPNMWVLRVCWVVQNPEHNKQYPQYKILNGWSAQEYQECWTRRYFECSQRILSKYYQYSKYTSSPQESTLLRLPFVGPSVIRECCLQ